MAVTVQYESHGRIHSWLLDIRELAHHHSGVALAAEFLKVLNDFGITDKVSNFDLFRSGMTLTLFKILAVTLIRLNNICAILRNF